MTALPLLLTLFAAPPDGDERSAAPLPTVAEATAECETRAGLLDLRVDKDRARLLAVLPPPDGDGVAGRFLYVTGLASGLGSNPIGLDRGRLGPSRVVRFVRVGRKLLVEQENLKFRASSEVADERRAVVESFAPSVLWAGDVVGRDPDGTFAVDLTSFVVRDADGIARTLAGEGKEAPKHELDRDASVLDPRACLAFPENVEFEARLTFRATGRPAAGVAETAATGEAATLVQHHSLVRLPDDGYRPRAAHPRAGYGAVSFLDYAAPLDAPIERRWIRRHRLERVDPAASRGKVKRPIVYHVDRGAPPAIRDALIEGASWWARAFEAAGFVDAFRVEVLPEGAHPLDVRYHTIHWVHRSTRGWSYGGGVHDPRTGEMVKGNVRLGSLRVRQDRRLFEGLGAADPVPLALARIRQLAAHEVGHTLGLQHNFAASTYGDRASVMDYPAPRIGIADDGTLDFSDAYGVGVGAWDVFAIRYGYAEFPPGTDEAAALAALIDEATAGGLTFASDDDARPLGSAHPLAHLWDNGGDPVAQLRHDLAVRRIALERHVPPDEETFVPVFLHHRYQAEAAAKLVAGVAYDHGGGEARPVDGARQRAALFALLDCLDPDVLDVPERIAARLLPAPPGARSSRERFRGRTGPTFDPLGAAAAAADHVVRALLHPARAARLLDQHRRDPSLPGLDELLDAVERRIVDPPGDDPRADALREVVASVALDRLLELAATDAAPAAVRGAALLRIERLALPGPSGRVASAARRRADAFLRGAPFPPAATTAPWDAPPLPPGSPIGQDGDSACDGDRW